MFQAKLLNEYCSGVSAEFSEQQIIRSIKQAVFSGKRVVVYFTTLRKKHEISNMSTDILPRVSNPKHKADLIWLISNFSNLNEDKKYLYVKDKIDNKIKDELKHIENIVHKLGDIHGQPTHVFTFFLFPHIEDAEESDDEKENIPPK